MAPHGRLRGGSDGGVNMEKEKIEQFFRLLDGVPYWEWGKIREQIEDIYRANQGTVLFDVGDMQEFFVQQVANNIKGGSSI